MLDTAERKRIEDLEAQVSRLQKAEKIRDQGINQLYIMSAILFAFVYIGCRRSKDVKITVVQPHN